MSAYPHEALRLQNAFRLVRRQIADGRARYTGLAVGRADGLVRAELHGPDGVLAGPRRFLIASITKPITATAILQLVEEGRLGLSDPIQRYIPEFRPESSAPGQPGAEAVTAWHLLTHTSGIADAGTELVETERPTPAALLDLACTRPLRFVPGGRYEYASDSFYLLAELVRRVGGSDLAGHLRGRIFTPLGMSATSFDPEDPGPPALPLGGYFDRFGLELPAATRYFVSLRLPGGGLWSTVTDLARFGRAMLNDGALDGGRVLGKPFVEQMTREQTAGILEAGDPPRDPHYALGWSRPGLVAGSPASPEAFGHSGATGSYLMVDPRRNLVIVVLHNEWDAPMAPTDELIEAVYSALD
jgi:CubicO group peptidase (beta-lactamase class C family)